jgi:hypothetical protein
VAAGGDSLMALSAAAAGSASAAAVSTSATNGTGGSGGGAVASVSYDEASQPMYFTEETEETWLESLQGESSGSDDGMTWLLPCGAFREMMAIVAMYVCYNSEQGMVLHRIECLTGHMRACVRALRRQQHEL